MRLLTARFSTYKIGKWEKATGKGIMDLLDFGNLEVHKLAEFIKLGNTFGKGADEDEEAYRKLDEYLGMDEKHSLISAMFTLIGEFDMDLKILRACGLNVGQIKDEFELEIRNRMKAKKIADAVENIADAVENIEEE